MAVTLDIEGSVRKLNADLGSTRESLVGVAEGYEQIGEASKKAVGGAAKDQDKLTTSTKKTGKALGEQENIIKKLENHLKRLEKGQKKTNDPKQVKKYNTEIAKTRAALSAVGTTGVAGIGAVSGAAKASTGVFRTLRATLATTFAPLFAVTAAVAGISKIITLVNAYEQTAADLQAITGANEDTLEFLKQSAVEVGLSTTISAAQTLEAYKLIASAKPELLSNASALAEITREAIALTEAMGGDLTVAATNLTDIMNQFNAPASEASKFVNALAAGSKEGSAEVGQLAASILVAGTEAKSSNVQFEETVGLLEVLAEKGKKGAEAGTGLRNILSKLSATEVLPKDAIDRLEAAGVDMDLLSDKTLSFSDRLRALAPIQNDSNALTAVFGLENKSVAQILLQNVDRIDELTRAVTDTNVAYEQASIRTSTASGEYAKLTNTIQALVTEAGGGISGLLATIISFVRNGLLFMRDKIADLKPAFQPVVDAVGNLFSAFKKLLPATGDTSKKAAILGKVIKILNIPLKVFFAILSAGINIITKVVSKFGDLVRNSPALTKFFSNISTGITNFLDALVLIPAYVSGGLAAIGVFVKETASSIAQLGRNIGKVLKESFSFGKLIREGTGDLKTAVAELLENPFAGIGTKASEAFTKEFDKAQKPIEVPIKTVAEGKTPTLEDEDKEEDKDKKTDDKKAEKEAREIAKLKIAAMRDGVAKELALEEARFTDLISKLKKYGIDSTEAVFQNELNKFKIKQKFLQDAADLEGLSGEERIAFIQEQTQAEIDALESALRAANSGELSKEQAAQLNLLRKKASEEHLKQLEQFQNKELAEAQQHEINLLELRAGEFETLKDFEEFKQKEILAIRLKYAEKQLAILSQLHGAESDAALAMSKIINNVKGEIEKLTAADNTASEFSIFKLIGIDPDDPKNKEIVAGIETAAATTIDVLSQINAARLQSANEAIAAKDKEIAAIGDSIEAKEEALEEELALADLGFSNSSDQVIKDIELLKQQQQAEKVERDKALEEKKKVQKQQAIIDTLTQGSSLISAAAQVFNSVAAIPFVGVAIGAALVATMLGSFVAAKAKIFQNINKQKAEKGMAKIVKGRRHSQGGEPLGDHVEIEGGEALGVLSRKATRSFGNAYLAFTNAANRGDKKAMSKIAAGLGGIDRGLATDLENKEAKVIQLKTEVTASIHSDELKENNKLLRRLLKNQNNLKSKTEYSEGNKITRTGNSTTRITRKRQYG